MSYPEGGMLLPNIGRVFGPAWWPNQYKVFTLPILTNSICAHHLVIYTGDLAEDRIKLLAVAKRESRDPDVPPRDWSVLCSAEMPEARLEEFVRLLQERLDGTPLELQELPLADSPS
jgi:hypothetical protein